MRQSAHWAALITALGGSLTLCYSDYTLDAGTAQLAHPPLIAAALFWLAEFAIAALTNALDRGLLAAPAIALIGFGLVHSHVPFQLAWHKSKDAFDGAAAEVRRDPQAAPKFHQTLGPWEIDLVQTEPGSSAVYFEVAGDGPDRPVFANVPGGERAGWGSYRDCERIEGDWYRCVWRF